MKEGNTFTEGKILQPLILFALPVLFALFLQAMYGAVDLLIIGKFASSADVSAVSTGSQIMMTLTNLISSFAMGTTVYLGQQIGSGKKEEGGKTVGTSIIMFAIIAIIMTFVLVIFAPKISSIMNAPAEAFDKTVAYVRICGGMLMIVAYNLIGCIFRGIGDSRTPLFTVAIACVCKIVGDLILCAYFNMGTEGAAFATVLAQVISVIISMLFISGKELPFIINKNSIRVHKKYLFKIVSIGAPLAKVSGDKKVVLGLITTKSPKLENKEEVIARIHEAEKYIPLDRLYLSPQCGFASCEIGNKLTEEEQWAKLNLVKEIAEEVWG